MNSFCDYSLNNEGRQEGILAQSKRISKVKKFQKKNIYEDDDASQAPSKASSHKKEGAIYDTFSEEEKPRLIAMMQKETEKICKDQVWHEAFLTFKANQYRPILAKVIPKFDPDFDPEDKNKRTQMWRKVRNIVKRKIEGKPETRGGPIILDNELPYFTEKVEEIIKTLKNKNFEAFRKRLLPVIKEIRTKAGRKYNSNVFKKHKWSKFINKPKNAALLALWEPIERTSAKNSSKYEEEQSDTLESCENTTMASPNEHSPIISQEASPQGMGEIIESKTSIVNPHRIPTFKESFERIMKMTPIFPQNQGAEDYFNLYQAPEYHSPVQYGNAHEKILIEYDDTYKLKMFNEMMNGTYEWDF